MMTDHRPLAETIARAIFDRIERDKTLILQNVADEIHDALVLEDAKRGGAQQIEQAAESLRYNRLLQETMRQMMNPMSQVDPAWPQGDYTAWFFQDSGPPRRWPS